MNLDNAVVTCAVNMQWSTQSGSILRKVSYRTATLRLTRTSNSRDIFVEINSDKLKPIQLKLKDFTVHKKFMSEGKASFSFNTERCVLFLSNAPPSSLITFLQIIFFKLQCNGDKDSEKKLRAQLLSGKPSQFQEISPLTNSEVRKVKKAYGIPVTPDSVPLNRKRKLSDIDSETEKPSSAKRLFDSGENKALSSPPSSILSSSEEKFKLNHEQNEVYEACLSGKNVFFTGSAGTGKSFLLRKIISALAPEGTVVTASTGVAACLIGGVTLHSFAGIGSGEAPLSRCYEMAKRSAQIWRKCKRLIVDEISMVDGQYFEKIEAVARYIRNNDRPFGGIQLILCGDFLQLPPIVKRDSFASTEPSSSNKIDDKKRFCFQSNAWDKCIQFVYELTQVHRQNDPEFIQILNHIRIGHITSDISKRLCDTANQNIEVNGILATQLCSHTNDANIINDSKLESLVSEKKLFKAEDSDPTMKRQLDQQIQAPSELILKIGAQVMLLKNINVGNGLVNGARGVVIKYENNFPLVKFKNNIEYLCKPEKWIIRQPSGATVTRKQVPLKLAWAFSIHKSQGLTLDCVEMSLSRVFEAGQAYVALSRAKSLDCVRILDFDSKQVWANPEVLRYYKTVRRRIHEMTYYKLGGKRSGNSKNNDEGRNMKAKLKKSVMEKPLVTIC